MTQIIQRSLKSKNGYNYGFTFVETLVSIAVLGMFFAAIAMILQLVLQNIGESRVRTTALALAQDRIERINNLVYDDVGTISGIPSGTISQNESVTINNLEFIISTSIIFIDDPFDGEAPDDLINTDYKRIRVEVTWGGAFPSRTPVTFVTNIAPKGVETVAGGGTLFIQVFDSQGLPVNSATVTINNTTVNPEIHTQTLTNTNGLVVIPGAPACITCYEISVTKGNDHSTDRTYSNSEVANPLLPHITVIEGELTPLSFSIDKVSMLTVRSFGAKNLGYPQISNVQFTLRGSKIIGYDTSDEPVYKYEFSTNTGGGSVGIPGLEWDTYTIDLSDSAHDLAGSNPVNPFPLAANSALTLNMVAVPKTNVSLLVVANDAAEQLLASASARLTNSGLAYDTTVYAGSTGSADFGQAFFNAIIPSTYNLKLSLPGYQEATASLILNGTEQEVYTLNLTE